MGVRVEATLEVRLQAVSWDARYFLAFVVFVDQHMNAGGLMGPKVILCFAFTNAPV